MSKKIPNMTPNNITKEINKIEINDDIKLLILIKFNG